MDEEFKELFKDLVDGLKKNEDLFAQAQNVNRWMRDIIGIALGRFAQRQEGKEQENIKIIEVENCANRSLIEKESDDMKNIRHRTDGRWEFRIRKHDEQVSITKQTKEELLKAVAKYRKSKKELKSNRLTFTAPRKTFKEFAEYWFKTFKSKTVSEQSLHSYRNILKNHLTPLANIQMSEIKLSDVQTVINAKSGRIRELCYLTIKQILKQAYYEDYLKKDLAQFVVKGKIKKEVRRNLTFQEQQILWKALKKDHLSLLIKFYLLTGARRAEAEISKSNLFQEKEDCYVLLEGTKTESSKRYVKISEKLYQELMSFPSDNLFYADWKSVEKRFREFTRGLGLKNITIHRLRHTFSTNLQVLGVPDKVRQMYLGHASIVTTNDVYTHIDPTLTKEKLMELYGEYIPRYI